MKRYLIAAVVVMTVLAVSWVVLAQEEQKPAAGQAPAAQAPAAPPAAPGPERGQGGGRGRGGLMMPEEQLKAVEAIEQQVTKLKEVVKTSGPPAGRSFQDLSDEERTKMREQMMKAGEERRAAIKMILTQLARLQGQQPAEGAEYIIVNTADLKSIKELADKEKATETAARLTALIERPQRGGMMGGGRGGRQGGATGEGGGGQRQRGAGAGGQGG